MRQCYCIFILTLASGHIHIACTLIIGCPFPEAELVNMHYGIQNFRLADTHQVGVMWCGNGTSHVNTKSFHYKKKS